MKINNFNPPRRFKEMEERAKENGNSPSTYDPPLWRNRMKSAQHKHNSDRRKAGAKVSLPIINMPD